MKITAVFLGNKTNSLKGVKEVLPKSTQNFKFLVYIFVSVFVLCTFAKHIKISPDIFNFATNFRQADDKKVEIADVLKVYNLFNSDNYIINQEKLDKLEKAKQEELNPYKNEIEIIDSLVKDQTEQAVFGGLQVDATITEENKSLQRVTVGTMKVLNYSTKREINFKEIAKSNITLTKKSDKILLYNTHTSESYANSENYQFEYTGTKRTTDANYNMLVIAKELNDNLRSKGFNSIQNTTPHDYGTYTSAYAKSRVTVKDALNQMGGAGISIDVHRDAASDLEYRPVTNIKGVQVAQLMFVMGVGSDTTKNEHYEDNLKLALKIQQIADKIYPGLFKPMIIRNSVYNQDLNKHSFLVEVGATGNTIEEAKLATRCLTNLLNIIYKD